MKAFYVNKASHGCKFTSCMSMHTCEEEEPRGTMLLH